MPLSTDTWSYDEFHAFVMLYAANTDGNISVEEEELIIPTLTAEQYTHVKSVFMACDDADALDIIFSFKDKYCKSKADKEKILADMKEIYALSTSYVQMEHELFRLFERMLCFKE